MRAVWHNIGQHRYASYKKSWGFMSDLYIGLMSGTSADGIDAALVDFSNPLPNLIATHYTPYSPAIRQKIFDLCKPGHNEIQRLGELDIELAQAFAESIHSLLQQTGVNGKNITAIGSHGQTIRHVPHQKHPFTLQIGDPNTIAALTGITTVADFRRKDMALGGQGAPLVPAFHQYLFADKNKNRAIANIGGIANVTLLMPHGKPSVLGFDTGPGNGLLDEWIQQHQQKPHDADGAWAASGNIHQPLLASLLADDYFKLPPPKSTGREYFNSIWLQPHLAAIETTASNADVQATLTEFTAITIANAIKQHMPDGEIYVCGGGARNAYLIERLQQASEKQFSVKTTDALGIHADWVEAIAFAWLAYQTINQRAGNLPSVTGAKQAAILGGLYYA